MKTRVRAVAVLLPALLLMSAGCDIAMADFSEQETAEWRKTYELSPGGRIEISNVNGKIQVSPGDGNAVEVYAKRIGKASSKDAAKAALDRVQIVDSSEGGLIRIQTKVDRSGVTFGHSQAQVEYVVRVPSNAELKVATVNGGVELAGLNGRLIAEATNGGIRATDIGGAIEATTTNGGVEVDLARVDEGGVKLECTNGGIKLRIPPDAKATINARISNGGISADGLNLDTRGESNRRRLDGDLNGGGPRIELQGTNGGIAISAR
jgi:DUF4097 and DUF4098 domain-containing protein YvlB